MSTNFHVAPPPKTVDGLLAVPIDIESVASVFTFDGSIETASADATITYTVGPTAGNPIFDLRQDVTQAWLDGVPFPVAQLAHHSFGGLPFTDLRVIDAVQAAGSVHTLRVQYHLGVPYSQLEGRYLPALEWSAGPKLRFVFGFSDLYRARYAEAWLPANLIFDQYSISLEMRIINTMAAHTVITNGVVTNLGMNHWRITFPSRFSAVSPMLEVRSSDIVTRLTDTVLLPVSGRIVTIEAWKPTSSTMNLADHINDIKTLLADNENNYGAYLHDDRFVVFFNGTSGMEYEGGTTTSRGALFHETFHNWFARGIKPASQADGWWDEGFTSFHDEGADDAIDFDFSDPPVLLCSRDSWQRHTPTNSYGDGSRFWKGMASRLGVSNLNRLMRELYETHKGRPVSTEMIEEFLLCKSGNAQIVDCFHRFVYGLEDPSPVPNLWFKDDPVHSGADLWEGPFWDSSDLWIRNADDGNTTHQAPVSGQDNWFYARVRNKAESGGAGHFVVTFHSRGYAGTEFVYPSDFLPCTAAKAEFQLAPGDTRIVKARWPHELVPPAGSHTCLLASVITRGDHPIVSRHVWEHNNLAQKNLTIVNLLPGTFMILPIVIGNWGGESDPRFELEVWRPTAVDGVRFSLVHRSRKFFRLANVKVKRFKIVRTKPINSPRQARLDCGGYIPVTPSMKNGRIITSNTPDLLLQRFPDSWEANFPEDDRAIMRVEIPPFMQKVVGLKVAISAGAKIGESLKLHLVQRNSATRQIVGGVAVEAHIGMSTRQ